MIPLSLSSGGSVLCFHALTAPALPSEGIVNLPLEQFQRLLRVARRVGDVVELGDLLRAHAEGRSTRGAVALTFDDAYASLLELLPLLRQEQVPITVFVVAEAAETGARFWWDRIEDLFPRTTPERWKLLESRLGLPDAYRDGQPSIFGPLRPLRQYILAEFGGRLPEVAEQALSELEAEAGFTTQQRSMHWAELQQMAEGTRVTFGVHTVTHPVLPLLPEAEAVSEIANCWERLQYRLPRLVPVLAIPYGLYDARTAGWARRGGMEFSLSLAGRTLAGQQAHHPLPRFCLTNREPGWKLALRLGGIADRLSGEQGYPDLPSATT